MSYFPDVRRRYYSFGGDDRGISFRASDSSPITFQTVSPEEVRGTISPLRGLYNVILA